MASSEDDNNNNNTNNNDSEMGYQYRGEMSSGSMFNNKSSSGSGNNLFGSGWDPLENFGGSSAYLQHHQNHQYHQSGSAIGDLVPPKIGSFGSGRFSEMVNPFVNTNMVPLYFIKYES